MEKMLMNVNKNNAHAKYHIQLFCLCQLSKQSVQYIKLFFFLLFLHTFIKGCDIKTV